MNELPGDTAPEDSWDSPDPYLSLEGNTEETRSFVESHNAFTIGNLGSDRIQRMRDQLLAAFASEKRLPFPYRRGEFFYDLLTDGEHSKGLYRRTTWRSLLSDDPDWEPVLDLDALAREEGIDWVFRGCVTAPPHHLNGLVKLSRSGSDATTLRELDLRRKSFRPGGFIVPFGRGTASWRNEDALLLMTTAADGEPTRAGYPRTVRLWERDTPIERAPVIFAVNEDDVAASAGVIFTSDGETVVFRRSITLETAEYLAQLPNGERLPLRIPADAKVQFAGDFVLVETCSAHDPAFRDVPVGSLLVGRLSAILRGEPSYQVLFTPSDGEHLVYATLARDHVTAKLLSDVRSKLLLYRPNDGRWHEQPISGLADTSTTNIWPMSYASEDWYVPQDVEPGPVAITAEDNVTPTTLYFHDGDELIKWRSEPALFDATGVSLTHHFTRSADGTPVHYFQIGPKELEGPRPAIVTSYGSWQISTVPSYEIDVGLSWLSRGGVYVLANVRGGGEYGRPWHEAGRRHDKINAVDDLAAVARDLIGRRVATPGSLGCHGISSGGWLVATTALRHPDLFRAVVATVPVLDKKRYARLLVGQSWIEEFGDPERADDARFLRRISPYHLIPESGAIPEFLLYTSTADDRVHPGHARKMAARLEAARHRVLFYESSTGGHSLGNSNEEQAFCSALQFAFFSTRLSDEKAGSTLGQGAPGNNRS